MRKYVSHEWRYTKGIEELGFLTNHSSELKQIRAIALIPDCIVIGKVYEHYKRFVKFNLAVFPMYLATLQALYMYVISHLQCYSYMHTIVEHLRDKHMVESVAPLSTP